MLLNEKCVKTVNHWILICISYQLIFLSNPCPLLRKYFGQMASGCTGWGGWQCLELTDTLINFMGYIWESNIPFIISMYNLYFFDNESIIAAVHVLKVWEPRKDWREDSYHIWFQRYQYLKNCNMQQQQQQSLWKLWYDQVSCVLFSFPRNFLSTKSQLILHELQLTEEIFYLF